MLKTIKKHSRKSKNFNSSFMAALIVAYFIGIYFSLLLGQSTLPEWKASLQGGGVLTFVLIIVLWTEYVWFSKRCEDKRDKQNFYDNYFMSIIMVVIGTLLVLYNPLIKKDMNWLWALFGILFIYLFSVKLDLY